MWTCVRLDLINVLTADSSMGLSDLRSWVRMMLSMTIARRVMLKWWRGSKRMMLAF
jgi:hypothetical protein